MPIESWPKMTTRRPLSACVVTAAAAQSTSASAVPSVITGFRPVSGQVPTLRCDSRPYWAIAPLTACAKTTPGFGPLLPQVKLIGVSCGELLEQRDHAELRERPGVGRADQHLDARVLELLGDQVGLRLAVHQRRRPHDLRRRAVGQLDALGQRIGHHLADVDAALPALRVDARVARHEHADRRRVAFVFRAIRECDCFGHVVNLRGLAD